MVSGIPSHELLLLLLWRWLSHPGQDARSEPCVGAADWRILGCEYRGSGAIRLGTFTGAAALTPLSPALVVRAIVLNGTAGVVLGALFRSYRLEWAMASHFGVDIVGHVALG